MAEALRPLLQGRALRHVRLHVRHDAWRERGGPSQALEGRVVSDVRAIGKHLLVTAGEAVLRVHLGMDGSWHRYAVGEPWQRSERDAGVVLETDADVVVCFQPQDVEVMAARDVLRVGPVARLGPDLCDPGWDRDEVLARARHARHAPRGIAEILLDQGVAAGIGNVFKSEVLFLVRVHPWTPTRAVPDETLGAIYDHAARLLQANVGTGPRTTTGDPRRTDPFARRGPRLWVYRRAGRPCLRCGERVRSAAQGAPTPRTTYWCPVCQPAPEP